MDYPIIFWKCRGAESEDFLEVLLDLLHRHRLYILVLAETKTSSRRENTFFDSLAVAEASGFAGGSWTFWRSNRVQNRVAAINYQSMTLLIMKKEQDGWVFTPIYASLNAANRDQLWSYVSRLGQCIKHPWLLLGDTNQTSSKDKQGGRAVFWRRTQTLWQVLVDCVFVDMGFSGSTYT
ncbi:hypothetical protein M9H77_30868 [Catharanthus roseus]|uniref:Uncharacterized protein n=1 Tax=Catharanthus roseus TaxID=4058 RepID=A0ACB9ZYV2_CATRO|nr:hypothetical protein M9H77_30868 [Catharanthus roseus]